MSKYVSVKLQRRVREHFASCCAYCRTAEDLTGAIFEFEHIVPRSAGGVTTFKNLCFSCPTSNRHKSNLVSAQDPLTTKEVALFHPHQDRWLEHFSWSGDATQIVGLTPTGRATIATLKMNRQQILRARKIWVAVNQHPPDLD
jgi:hypothetical protein